MTLEGGRSGGGYLEMLSKRTSAMGCVFNFD